MAKKPLTKKLDEVFSKFIRQRDMDVNGFTECFTCGKYLHWTKIQCGHFQSRKHMSTRWDEINCQPQCSACNIFNYGEQFKFSKHLDLKYGEGTAELMETLSRKLIKFQPYELQEKIDYYANKIKL